MASKVPKKRNKMPEMEDVWKYFEKNRKFLREMIVLLYRFSKVVGLICKLDETVFNCRSFSGNFLEVYRTMFTTARSNSF